MSLNSSSTFCDVHSCKATSFSEFLTPKILNKMFPSFRCICVRCGRERETETIFTSFSAFSAGLQSNEDIQFFCSRALFAKAKVIYLSDHSYCSVLVFSSYNGNSEENTTKAIISYYVEERMTESFIISDTDH